MILQTKHYVIEQIDQKKIEDECEISADYIICQSDVLDSVYEDKLISRGYRFLDRLLYFEIETSIVKSSDDNVIQDVDFLCDREYDDVLFDTACQAYTTDRRFHLNPVFDQQSADDVIEAFIDYCKKQDYKIYKAVHNNELLGFAIVDDVDKNRAYFENILGATKPGIKGKMIAGPLYKFMIKGENEKFKKYAGRVSSSNIASINLHTALGGRVKKIYDEFIFDNRR